MAAKPEKVIHRTLDLRPFAGAARKLAADPKAWIETSELLADLQWTVRAPIPEPVLAHLRARLDGTARKRQGRGRSSPSLKIRHMWISVRFERIEAWLKARQRSQGLKGWRLIRDAEWWQGPPSERAARMVKSGLELNMTWEAVRNIAYRIRKNGMPVV